MQENTKMHFHAKNAKNTSLGFAVTQRLNQYANTKKGFARRHGEKCRGKYRGIQKCISRLLSSVRNVFRILEQVITDQWEVVPFNDADSGGDEDGIGYEAAGGDEGAG